MPQHLKKANKKITARRGVARRRTVKRQTASERHALRHEKQRVKVWALLSLAAFLVSYIASIVRGDWGALPFFYGALALTLVMLLEALIRGRLWIFETDFSRTFGHPHIGLRLIFFSVASLLVLETAIITVLFIRS
jgi:hypothetical protein